MEMSNQLRMIQWRNFLEIQKLADLTFEELECLVHWATKAVNAENKIIIGYQCTPDNLTRRLCRKGIMGSARDVLYLTINATMLLGLDDISIPDWSDRPVSPLNELFV